MNLPPENALSNLMVSSCAITFSHIAQLHWKVFNDHSKTNIRQRESDAVKVEQNMYQRDMVSKCDFAMVRVIVTRIPNHLHVLSIAYVKYF